ncbi:MAG TPA: glucokinase [Verrucomicrobiae bacterium]|nr:glucokinase [Verrucomicrobiae bacterium]
MILAGDIGGTKVNLAWFNVEGGQLVRGPEATYRSRDHDSLCAIIQRFTSDHSVPVRIGAFGVAGPIRDGRAQLTNLSWIVDAEELQRELKLDRVFLLNDLQANAYGISTLEPGEVIVLNAGSPARNGNLAIISAGTGLGQAALLWTGSEYIAIASEGGHADFAPRTDLDAELLAYLRERFVQPSWEHVLSGPGFYHVYQFLRDSGHGEEPGWLTEEFRRVDPAVAITKAGLAQTCPLCVQTLDLFVGYYGAEAANLSLKFLATGGLYLGGGIAPKIAAKLQDGSFLRSFIGQGRMKDLLGAIPVRVILNDKAALIGAARHAATRSGLL